jgi:hypothetical protein
MLSECLATFSYMPAPVGGTAVAGGSAQPLSIICTAPSPLCNCHVHSWRKAHNVRLLSFGAAVACMNSVVLYYLGACVRDTSLHARNAAANAPTTPMLLPQTTVAGNAPALRSSGLVQ